MPGPERRAIYQYSNVPSLMTRHVQVTNIYCTSHTDTFRSTCHSIHSIQRPKLGRTDETPATASEDRHVARGIHPLQSPLTKCLSRFTEHDFECRTTNFATQIQDYGQIIQTLAIVHTILTQYLVMSTSLAIFTALEDACKHTSAKHQLWSYDHPLSTMP